MRVICHRGWFLTPDERNTREAFARSFAAGLGAEIDVRDLDGALVVSHDPPTSGTLTLDEVLELHSAAGFPGELAMNVKADGLCSMLSVAMADTPRWAAFDMSVPDTLEYRRRAVPYLTRQSEHEPTPSLYDAASGVWLDCFEGEWFSQDVVRGHLEAGRRVCIVSPELHGRPHADAWRQWSEWEIRTHPELAICTDHPSAAQEQLG